MRVQEGRRVLRPFLQEMQGKLLQRQVGAFFILKYIMLTPRIVIRFAHFFYRNAVPESENEDVDGDLQEI